MTDKRKHKLCMVDMDDTLIFTAAANHMAYKTALNEYGFDCTEEYYKLNCNGRSYKDFLPEIMGEGNPLMEKVHERKMEVHASCCSLARVNRPLLDILRAIKGEYYLALVTTGSRQSVENMLAHFGLTGLFDMTVCREDMPRPKPDPICYKMVMEKYGISAENSMIFEDSPTGTAAALASGCPTFCIRQG